MATKPLQNEVEERGVAIKVYKIYEIVEGDLVFSGKAGPFSEGDAAALLTNLEPVSEPDPKHQWRMELLIGEGATARPIMLDLPPLISVQGPVDTPIFLADARIVFFRHRMYMPERQPRTEPERQEVVLRVKKLRYEEDAELQGVRSAVANLEAALEYARSGSRRDPIPDDVKIAVWARDKGACVRCRSRQRLHFDHIIPVALGGGVSIENIQVLCESCNLRKSDKIAG